ncbi:hypothetical protein ZIOFF_006059 [Zingiber officinale]|uniref:Protein ENHANCED DISEASE RESISTANCE 2 C-terminal domain-containing protein n=1 Tax=Zingiber officinale TaxID=94328 RepID=A0A8J5HYC8_ZINOF|nr:hypothetical protein ZIOFF_006059 [Zingiber officinale]
MIVQIDVDIGSSTVANGVLGLVFGVITSLVVDMAFLIQAIGSDELPERLIGALQDIKLYTFYMELDLQKSYPTRGSDLLTWEFTNLKYFRVEIDEVQFESAECMLDYI